MRAKEFLLEYDRSREQQRIESLPAYQNRLKEDPEFSLEKLESADPTPQKTYVPRLVTWWMRGAKIEDLISRGADNLEKFAQLKQKNLLKPEHKDINVFKQFADFEDVIASYQQPNQPEEKQDRGKYKEIYRDDELLVVELLDETAAKFWGQGTRWCTAAKNNNRFSMYENEGPLFVIIPRKDPENKYQYWFDKSNPYDMQFMDVEDKKFNPRDLSFFSKLQKIMQPLSTHIMWNANPTEQEQLAAMKQDGFEIQYIKNPSEAVQKAAVQNYGPVIGYIENPSEEVKLAAVQQNGRAIHYIKNPSEEMQLEAVQHNGLIIQYIENPSEAVQMAAVRMDSYSIRFIKHPTEAVQLAAVRQNSYAIKYIKNPSEEVQLAAVQEYKGVIDIIKNPTPKVKALANK